MKLLSGVFCVIVLLTGCVSSKIQPPSGSNTMIDIRLPVGYIPNIQFAPLYVAIEKGYYTDENLKVSLDYSFETDAVALVGSDELQFAIASGEQVLLARAQGVPIVYTMAWYQKYPVAVASKAGRGILKPEDLRGKRIGTPVLSGASYIGLKTILSAGGLTEGDIVLQTIGFNQVEMLSTDRVDAAVVYVANEPVILASLGYPTDLIRVDDYLTLVSNGLITNEKTVTGNPDLIRRMIRATLRGIEDTITDPDDAYRISKKYIETLAQADEGVQKQILTRSISLWQAKKLGESNPSAWDNMMRVLKDMGLLTREMDVSQAFTNEFLP